jgi:hypothetical protein
MPQPPRRARAQRDAVARGLAGGARRGGAGGRHAATWFVAAVHALAAATPSALLLVQARTWRASAWR